MKNIFPCFSRQNFIIGKYFIILLNIKYAIRQAILELSLIIKGDVDEQKVRAKSSYVEMSGKKRASRMKTLLKKT